MTSGLLTLSGAPVSRLGLGCSQVGSFGNPASLAQSRALIRRALDLGVNHFDTADIYGQGDSERAIGRAVRGRRGEAFVVTKFGKRFSARMRLLRPLKPLVKPLLRARSAAGAVVAQRGGMMREDFSPARLPAALAASLNRLRLEAVDAVLLHGPSVAALGDPALEAALAAILKAGLARHVGVSVDTEEELEAAAALAPATIFQVPYSLAEALDRPGLAARLAGRFVFAREVIRLQPQLAPLQAAVRSLAQPRLAGVIVGTGSPDHLEALAQAARAAATT